MTDTFPLYLLDMWWEDLIHGVPDACAILFLILYALYVVVTQR